MFSDPTNPTTILPVLRPMPMRSFSRPSNSHFGCRMPLSNSTMPRAVEQARYAWLCWGVGAPQKAMMASPMYLSNVPSVWKTR